MLSFSLLVTSGLLLLGQASNGQVVDHLFNLFHVILEAIIALAQRVVLQIEQAETRVQLVDEVGDTQWAPVVSRCDAVHSQTGLRQQQI